MIGCLIFSVKFMDFFRQISLFISKFDLYKGFLVHFEVYFHIRITKGGSNKCFEAYKSVFAFLKSNLSITNSKLRLE